MSNYFHCPRFDSSITVCSLCLYPVFMMMTRRRGVTLFHFIFILVYVAVYIASSVCIAMSIHFVLCESCFWCASQSSNSNTYNRITKCPSSRSNQIESMPISQNELYDFSYDPIRGVTLVFSKSRS